MIDSSDDEIEGDPCGFLGGELLPLSPSSLESPFDILTPCLPMSDLDHRTYIRTHVYRHGSYVCTYVHTHTHTHTHTDTYTTKGTSNIPP